MATGPALYVLPFLIFKRRDKEITGTSWGSILPGFGSSPASLN